MAKIKGINMEKWMFCFVCKQEFKSIDELVKHINEQGHKLSKESRDEFRKVQDLVGKALGNF